MFHELAVEIISFGKRQFEDDRLVLLQLVELFAQGHPELVFYLDLPGAVDVDLRLDNGYQPEPEDLLSDRELLRNDSVHPPPREA